MIGRRVLLAGLALTGCKSADPKLYTLVMKPGPMLGSTGTITIRSPVLPRYVERQEVIRRESDDQMKSFDNDWWSEPIAEMVRRLLVADLAQRLPNAKVLGSGGIAGDAATIEIEIELERFDTDAGGRAVLSGFAAIESKGRPRRLEKLRVEVPPLGPLVAARVEAMSLALGQAADQIAAMLMA